ncbi:MAG: hypothetical protein KAS30_00940, partial [Candidatus Diapherotrites archaeon]|nr:hypothetical protein [Candidatus Diapherotrites archaeon]
VTLITSITPNFLFKPYNLTAEIKNDVAGVDANYTADAKNVIVNFKINSPFKTPPASITPDDFKPLGTQTIDVLGTNGSNQAGTTETKPIYWIDFNTGFNLNVEVNPDISTSITGLGRVVVETDYSDNSATKDYP